MKRTFSYTVLLLTGLAVLTSVEVRAQDEIYFKSGKINDWTVTDISTTDINATYAQNPGVPYATARSGVYFIFNRVGNFLVIPTLSDADPASQKIRNNYFTGVSDALGHFDRIITVNNDILTGNYVGPEGSNITYTVNGAVSKVPSSDVVLIIFMDGTHKLFTNTFKAYQVLNSIQQTYYDLAFGAAPAGTPQTGPGSGTTNAAPGKGTTATTSNPPSSGKGSKKSKGNSTTTPPLPTTTSPTTAASGSTPGTTTTGANGAAGNKTPVNSGSGGTTTGGASAADTASDLTLTEDQKDEFSEKAIQKAKDFGYYLQEICNKNTDLDKIDAIIDQAITLFVDEDRVIEVSSARGVQQKKIREYMNHLMNLHYDKVNIQWYNVQFVNRFHKGPDGNYYGEIEFEQKFTATTGDNYKAFSDVTRKKAEVILKLYTKVVEGKAVRRWDVLLGDMGVAEIKSS